MVEALEAAALFSFVILSWVTIAGNHCSFFQVKISVPFQKMIPVRRFDGTRSTLTKAQKICLSHRSGPLYFRCLGWSPSRLPILPSFNFFGGPSISSNEKSSSTMSSQIMDIKVFLLLEGSCDIGVSVGLGLEYGQYGLEMVCSVWYNSWGIRLYYTIVGALVRLCGGPRQLYIKI